MTKTEIKNLKKRLKEIKEDIKELKEDYKNGWTLDGEKMLENQYHEYLFDLEEELENVKNQLEYGEK